MAAGQMSVSSITVTILCSVTVQPPEEGQGQMGVWRERYILRKINLKGSDSAVQMDRACSTYEREVHTGFSTET
jgi:hypothetical protein